MYILIGITALCCAASLAALVIPFLARRKRTERRRLEFTKIMLSAVMATYFIVVIVGVRLSFLNDSTYTTLAALVGTPVVTALGFYAWKAKAENIVKIKKDNPEETQGIPVDLNNINT